MQHSIALQCAVGRFQCCQTLTILNKKQTVPPSEAMAVRGPRNRKPKMKTAAPARAAVA
jgi:hypothetical protein